MNTLIPTTLGDADTLYAERPHHRRWLEGQADRLFDFFGARAINPRGGFYEFDKTGAPVTGGEGGPVRGLHATARMIHCHAIGALLGRPGSEAMVDHGMRFLNERHRDRTHGGYFWAVDDAGATDPSKQGYGHAFVLLAASSARCIGHPLADEIIADVSEILDRHFWEEGPGAIREAFGPAWEPQPGYRGQNCNMHLTEALMAAFETTGEHLYLTRAERIAALIIGRHAAENNYRVAEHFTEEWEVDHGYDGHEMFRPSGTTPGHALEWARLLLQLFALGGKRHVWMVDAAKALFFQAMALGWDPLYGGFYYTLGWDNQPSRSTKLWWPLCEGAAAAHFLNHHAPSAFHEASYRKIWGVIANHFIDTTHGGWHEECTDKLVPAHRLFPGKGDLYHALQACLIPLYPATGSLTRVARGG